MHSAPGPSNRAWSYDLLTDDERALLRATSVFPGGFGLASIHAVATCGDVVDVLRHLDALVRKSLVAADHSTTRTRYSLFETIRQFAGDRLEAAGELAATGDRHAAHSVRGPRALARLRNPPSRCVCAIRASAATRSGRIWTARRGRAAPW